MPLDGTWYNELQSTMQLAVAADGSVSGTYQTAVSGSNCAQGTFPVSGRARPGGGTKVNVGFAVSWENAQSTCDAVTAWSGEYRTVSVNGVQTEMIKTTWLLTIETDQPDDWKSTLIGQDVFTRTPPTPQQLQVAKTTKRLSHPGKSAEPAT
jgi:hypothetical protein